MKIIIAPDSFKESLSAKQAAEAIAQGFRSQISNCECILVPMADGGEGTLECLAAQLPMKFETAKIKNPLGEHIEAQFGVLPDTQNTAIIEVAEACGLSLILKENRNILASNTYGVGELILAALNKKAKKIVLCLGGTATCDGGMGALAALGAIFKNEAQEILEPLPHSLLKVREIDISNLDPRLSTCEFILAHDVNNPLLGLEGALMYAPQKGARAEEVEILHKGLENFAFVLEKYISNLKNSKPISSLPGAGAAGGLGAGLYPFLNAKFIPGAEFIIEKIQLSEKMKGASLVITGEGQLDGQTLHGKTALSLAKLSKQEKLPVIAIVGNMGPGFEEAYFHGIDAIFSIATGPLSQSECIKDAKHLLIKTSINIARVLKLKI